MALNVNISEQNKERLFDNNVGRKYSAASCISYIVQNDKFPKIDHSVSLEYTKSRFWEEVDNWTNEPVNNMHVFMLIQDKHCYLSIFPNYNRILGNMDSKHHLEVFARGENDSFKTTIKRLPDSITYSNNRLIVAINSAFMNLFAGRITYALTFPNPIPYSLVGVNGIVSHYGENFKDNYEPSEEGFHILHAFESLPPSRFYFGQGEVPLGLGDGIGALTPILLFNETYNKVWRYGIKNVYEEGHSGPESGDPGEDGQYILIRSNIQYRDLNMDDPNSGKNILAYCEEKDVLLLITAPDDGSAKDYDYYRDHLYRLGFENAVALDGGSSVTLYSYNSKNFYVKPLWPVKDNSLPIGFIFYV